MAVSNLRWSYNWLKIIVHGLYPSPCDAPEYRQCLRCGHGLPFFILYRLYKNHRVEISGKLGFHAWLIVVVRAGCFVKLKSNQQMDGYGGLVTDIQDVLPFFSLSRYKVYEVQWIVYVILCNFNGINLFEGFLTQCPTFSEKGIDYPVYGATGYKQRAKTIMKWRLVWK